MKSFNNSDSTHPSGNDELRTEYIESSLLSSRVAMDRLSFWKTSNQPGRLIELTFHEEWRHGNCPVMEWYKELADHATEFFSLEHRQDTNGPFFHEFLVFKLPDGSVCRLERMGDGSRFDAVRSTGCIARDLIQVFAEQDYQAFTDANPSRLLAEIQFDKQFDIIDVLAICYSIQRIRACQVYTLQRYNCYFLCWTIISILARRTASWEDQITTTTWDSAIASVLAQLRNTSPEDSQEYWPLVRYFRVTGFDGELVLDKIRCVLKSDSQSLSHLRRAVSATLWSDGSDLTISDSWTSLLESAFQSLVRARDQLAAPLIDVMSHGEEIIKQNLDVAQAMGAVVFHHVSQIASQAASDHLDSLALLTNEQPVLSTQIRLARSTSMLAAVLCRITPWSVSKKMLYYAGVDLNYVPAVFCQGTGRFKRDFGNFLSWGGILTRPEFQAEMLNNVLTLAFSKHLKSCAKSGLDELESRGLLTGDNSRILWSVIATAIKLEYLVAEIISSETIDHLHKAALVQTHHLRLVRGPKGVEKVTTTRELQDRYLWPRIQAHANRVGYHQLATPLLVSNAIKETMSTVWRSLPPDFGAVRGVDASLDLGTGPFGGNNVAVNDKSNGSLRPEAKIFSKMKPSVAIGLLRSGILDTPQ